MTVSNGSIFLGPFLTHLSRSEQIAELKSALEPLSARSEKYCSEACLTRYLEARNWNVAKSRKMLEDSLKWRAAYRPEDIRWVNPPFHFYLACIPEVIITMVSEPR
jgi:hypothetical protein